MLFGNGRQDFSPFAHNPADLGISPVAPCSPWREDAAGLLSLQYGVRWLLILSL
jgi:hypothetical protein